MFVTRAISLVSYMHVWSHRSYIMIRLATLNTKLPIVYTATFRKPQISFKYISPKSKKDFAKNLFI